MVAKRHDHFLFYNWKTCHVVFFSLLKKKSKKKKNTEKLDRPKKRHTYTAFFLKLKNNVSFQYCINR